MKDQRLLSWAIGFSLFVMVSYYFFANPLSREPTGGIHWAQEIRSMTFYPSSDETYHLVRLPSLFEDDLELFLGEGASQESSYSLRKGEISFATGNLYYMWSRPPLCEHSQDRVVKDPSLPLDGRRHLQIEFTSGEIRHFKEVERTDLGEVFLREGERELCFPISLWVLFPENGRELIRESSSQ